MRGVFPMAGHSWNPTIKILPLPEAAGLDLPAYQTPGAAGLDLRSIENVMLEPGGRRLVRTGLQIEVPPGYEAQIRPRSGMAITQGITVLNSPGTIDSDYRGEIMVILANLGTAAQAIKRGDRIAQMVIAPVARADIEVVSALSETQRGAGAFGSTGRG